MAWAPVLLVILSHCSGSLPQPVLTQPPSLSASLGASARLTCTLSSGSSVGGYGTSWPQQKPGSPSWYLLYYQSGKDQSPRVPSHFSESEDASANSGILHISGLQAEDEVDYYCTTWQPAEMQRCSHERARPELQLEAPAPVTWPWV
uniref:Ig-like domain-containing protein n=1 Tax=Otolemur garnettii TaxID=30611 RepID=H0Y2F0_OTOGA